MISTPNPSVRLLAERLKNAVSADTASLALARLTPAAERMTRNELLAALRIFDVSYTAPTDRRLTLFQALLSLLSGTPSATPRAQLLASLASLDPQFPNLVPDANERQALSDIARDWTDLERFRLEAQLTDATGLFCAATAQHLTTLQTQEAADADTANAAGRLFIRKGAARSVAASLKRELKGRNLDLAASPLFDGAATLMTIENCRQSSRWFFLSHFGESVARFFRGRPPTADYYLTAQTAKNSGNRLQFTVAGISLAIPQMLARSVVLAFRLAFEQVEDDIAKRPERRPFYVVGASNSPAGLFMPHEFIGVAPALWTTFFFESGSLSLIPGDHPASAHDFEYNAVWRTDRQARKRRAGFLMPCGNALDTRAERDLRSLSLTDAFLEEETKLVTQSKAIDAREIPTSLVKNAFSEAALKTLSAFVEEKYLKRLASFTAIDLALELVRLWKEEESASQKQNPQGDL